MMTSVVRGPVYETITLDALVPWGCRAYLSSGAWFQLKRLKRWEDYHIALAVAMWGSQWQGRPVRYQCDNAVVVVMLRSRWCKNKQVMHLLRSLCIFLPSCLPD